jgi:hypothetical protein
MRTPHASRRRPWWAGIALASTLSLAALGPASADEDAKTKAQKLFIEGLADIQKGNVAAGCEKLRESQKLFTAPNTLFNLAKCSEGEGKIAAALEHWERGLALIDAKDARAKVANKRIEELDVRVPRLRIVVPMGQKIELVVLDGQELAPTALDEPLRVEPGTHAVVVRAPGRQDRRYDVDLAEKERRQLEVKAGPEQVAQPLPTGTATGTATAPVKPPPSSGSFRRTAGFVVGGVGVAGVVTAGVTGVMYLSTLREAQDKCKGQDPCSDPSFTRLKTLGVTNAISWGVAVAGVGAGLALILTAPSDKEPRKDKGPATAFAPLFVPGGGGASVSGRF